MQGWNVHESEGLGVPRVCQPIVLAVPKRNEEDVSVGICQRRDRVFLGAVSLPISISKGLHGIVAISTMRPLPPG